MEFEAGTRVLELRGHQPAGTFALAPECLRNDRVRAFADVTLVVRIAGAITHLVAADQHEIADDFSAGGIVDPLLWRLHDGAAIENVVPCLRADPTLRGV